MLDVLNYKAAMARIIELMDAVAGTPEAEELSVLVDLVVEYEKKAFPIEEPTVEEMIHFRKEQEEV